MVARFASNRLALASALVLAVVAVIAVLETNTELVGRHHPDAQQYETVHAGPGGEYWLGTDGLGRSTWARLWRGTLVSLEVAVAAQLAVLVIGVAVGLLAALAGRVADALLTWLTDVTYAFPDLLAIILLRQVLLDRDWPVLGSGSPKFQACPDPSSSRSSRSPSPAG